MRKKFVAIIFSFIFLLNTFCFASGEEIFSGNVSDETSSSGDLLISGENINSDISGIIDNVSGSVIDDVSGDISSIVDEEITKSVPKFVNYIEVVILIYVFYKMCNHIKESGKVFKPDPIEKVKYCKDVPIEGMTVGQAAFLKDTELMNISNIFLGNILSLKQKGIIDLVSRGGDVYYKMLDVDPDVFVEEKDVYDFMNAFSKKFSRNDGYISLRSLQRVMMRSSHKVAQLKDNMKATIKKSLLYYNDELDKRIFNRIKDSAIYLLISIVILIIHGSNFGIFEPAIWTIILSIINILLCGYIAKNTVVFDEIGMATREKVKAFQRYMLNFSSNKETGVPELNVWEKNLNFALGFGVAEKVIEQIKASYPNFEETALSRECLICKRLIGLKFNQCFINAISFKIWR